MVVPRKPRTALGVQSGALQELVKKLDDHAGELGFVPENRPTGRGYRLPSGPIVLGVYWDTGRGLELNLEHLRTLGDERAADDVMDRVSAFLKPEIEITARLALAIPLVDVEGRTDEAVRGFIDFFLRKSSSRH